MNLLDLSQFKSLKELQEFAEKQFRTILILESTIKENKDKITHLETLLNNMPNSSLVTEDKEIEICKIEINRLYNYALREPLDDKQVRNLEIYVRTLALARGKSLDAIKEKKDKTDLKSMPVGKLIELAKSVKDSN